MSKTFAEYHNTLDAGAYTTSTNKSLTFAEAREVYELFARDVVREQLAEAAAGYENYFTTKDMDDICDSVRTNIEDNHIREILPSYVESFLNKKLDNMISEFDQNCKIPGIPTARELFEDKLRGSDNSELFVFAQAAIEDKIFHYYLQEADYRHHRSDMADYHQHGVISAAEKFAETHKYGKDFDNEDALHTLVCEDIEHFLDKTKEKWTEKFYEACKKSSLLNQVNFIETDPQSPHPWGAPWLVNANFDITTPPEDYFTRYKGELEHYAKEKLACTKENSFGDLVKPNTADIAAKLKAIQQPKAGKSAPAKTKSKTQGKSHSIGV